MKLALLLCALLAGSAHADFLDGRVVDSNGVGIPNVDLDVKNLGSGGTPNIFNDGSDANGFFHVTVPNGTYRVTLNPPQPPGSTGLVTEIASVTIVGTANFGTVTINPGVTITGHVQNNVGVPVVGVNIDVIDPSGTNAALLYDSTDAAGNFALNVPPGAIQVRFDPSTVVGTTLAPLAFDITANSAYAFGTIQLQPGFVVSGIVRNPSGVAIANADADVYDVTTGAKLFTPGDTSSSTGFLDIVVPAGSWDVDIAPPTGMALATRRFNALSVAAATNLGIVTLPTGLVLSGHVSDCNGLSMPGANVDLKDSTTGLSVGLSNDGTNEAGNYAVYVATGTYDVHLKPPAGQNLAVDVRRNVTIAGATVVNGLLGPPYTVFCFGDGSGTACPCGNGSTPGANAGCASSLGFGGRLLAEGSACVTADNMHLVGHDMGSAPALYFQGTLLQSGGVGLAFGDGLLCAGGTITRLGVKFNVNGSSIHPGAGDPTIGIAGAAVGGATRTYQAWYRDAATFCTAANYNLTNGLQVVWAP